MEISLLIHVCDIYTMYKCKHVCIRVGKYEDLGAGVDTEGRSSYQEKIGRSKKSLMVVMHEFLTRNSFG